MDGHLMQNTGRAALGLLFLGGGLWAWFFVGRRRFNRRNMAGVEEFDGYAIMLGTKFFEKMLRILAVVLVLASFGLMISGVPRSQTMLKTTTPAKVAKPGRVGPASSSAVR